MNREIKALLKYFLIGVFWVFSAENCFSSSNPPAKEPFINIRIQNIHTPEVVIRSARPMVIKGYATSQWWEVPAEESITVSRVGKRVEVTAGQKTVQFDGVQIKGIAPLEITNYLHPNFGTPQRTYNRWRGELRVFPEFSAENSLLVVNRLKLSDYLAGIAEEPVTEPLAKRQAIIVLARSYGLAYGLGQRRKFQTNRYDLTDDPRNSQLYLGYDWEQARPEQRGIVNQTRGVALLYNGVPVVGPYFSQSNGQTSDRWQRAYPWTQAQRLPMDQGKEQKGHGVGLSGSAAHELANQGLNYEEILKYFFQGVQVAKWY